MRFQKNVCCLFSYIPDSLPIQTFFSLPNQFKVNKRLKITLVSSYFKVFRFFLRSSFVGNLVYHNKLKIWLAKPQEYVVKTVIIRNIQKDSVIFNFFIVTVQLYDFPRGVQKKFLSGIVSNLTFPPEHTRSFSPSRFNFKLRFMYRADFQPEHFKIRQTETVHRMRYFLLVILSLFIEYSKLTFLNTLCSTKHDSW